ncbi:hypothetical protein ACIGD1_11400 [Streptomyces sp. NPDC085612]|uniref:hypothetical protein n=1 Tax=Streptomyces sp. NPDC085612 TaxID=3365732 RepID=UPI0037D135EA
MTQPPDPKALQQHLLHTWNTGRFARDAFQQSVRRSTERLLTRPPDTTATR